MNLRPDTGRAMHPELLHPHFLFAIWMVGGIQTVYNNMRAALEGKDGARFSWLPVEMYPDDWITKIPPISLNGSWKNSMATWSRMKPLIRAKGDFHAAYVLEHTLLTFLWGFRRRVPFLLATDMTPLFCAKHKLWYAVPEFEPASRSSRIKQAITRNVYSSAYHLLPWSTAVRDSFVEDYGIPAQRITVLPPGIDLKRWHPRNHRERGTPFRKNRSRCCTSAGTSPAREGICSSNWPPNRSSETASSIS